VKFASFKLNNTEIHALCIHLTEMIRKF